MTRLRKLEYGLPSGNDALTVRLGIEKGLFEAEGLDLSVRIVFGGPELADAFREYRKIPGFKNKKRQLLQFLNEQISLSKIKR